MSTAVLAPEPLPVEDGADSAAPRRAQVSRRGAYIALGVVVVVTNVMVLGGVHWAGMSPGAGLLTIFGVPTFLLYGANPAGLTRGTERLAFSVVLAVGLLMAAALLANSVGPHVSIPAPLGAGTVTGTVDVTILGLAIWAWRRQPHSYAIPVGTVSAPGRRVLTGGAGAVTLAALGATRLNNGAGGGVSLAGLGLVLATFAALLVWRNRIEPGAVVATIYLLSVAILFMTSLRGWYTTGHDIQREFQVFQLTKSLGRWDMSRYKDGYNACLSITILPTILARWTGIADPYVFKVVFQLLFAFCPVLVYHLAHRFVSGGLALLATIYFVAFPTFLQDMPFLNRQEVALLFLAAGLLCLFNINVDLARRKRWFCVLALGMVVSHYSTTYITVAVLLSATALRIGVPLVSAAVNAARGTPERHAWLLSPTARSSALGLGTIAFVTVAAMLWTGPLTGISGSVTRTASSAIGGVLGREAASKSSDTSYSLLSTAKPAAARLLDEYRRDSQRTRTLAPSTFYDDSAVSRYPVPIAAPRALSTTILGALVQRTGVRLPAFNHLVRLGSARLLQLFIAVGLLTAVFARRRSVAASADLVYLGAANLLVLILQVVLPALSVDYGLLRAFQQALLVLDVFLVIGSVALIPGFLGRWQKPAAALISLCFLASSTGFVTQLLGGYDAQLHLNNSGSYYDLYYVHPEEVTASAWLRRNIDRPTASGIQSAIQTDSFTFPSLQTLDPRAFGNDIFPPLVRRSAYVLLGFANVVKGESTVFYGGDLITYRYPLAFLDENKDLLYSTASSRVYR